MTTIVNTKKLMEENAKDREGCCKDMENLCRHNIARMFLAQDKSREDK